MRIAQSLFRQYGADKGVIHFFGVTQSTNDETVLIARVKELADNGGISSLHLNPEQALDLVRAGMIGPNHRVYRLRPNTLIVRKVRLPNNTKCKVFISPTIQQPMAMDEFGNLRPLFPRRRSKRRRPKLP